MNNNRQKSLEITLSVILSISPLVLYWIDGYWRESISDYAYSEFNHFFVFVLSLGGSMFMFNGVFFKKHWYNIILGISLYGVGLTPHRDYATIHYVFASVFFVGSILAIQLSSDKRFRLQKYCISLPIAVALLLHFLFGLYPLLVAEWIAIIPISIHFILKSINNQNYA